MEYIHGLYPAIVDASSSILTATWLGLHFILTRAEPGQAEGQHPTYQLKKRCTKTPTCVHYRHLSTMPCPGTTSNRKMPHLAGVCKFAHTVRPRGRDCRHCTSFRQARGMNPGNLYESNLSNIVRVGLDLWRPPGIFASAPSESSIFPVFCRVPSAVYCLPSTCPCFTAQLAWTAPWAPYITTRDPAAPTPNPSPPFFL